MRAQSQILKGNGIGEEEGAGVVDVLDRLDGLPADMRDEFAEIEAKAIPQRGQIADGGVLHESIEVADAVLATGGLDGVDEDVLGITESQIELGPHPTHLRDLLDLQLPEGETERLIVDIEDPTFDRQIARLDHGEILVGIDRRALRVIEVAFEIAIDLPPYFDPLEQIDLGELAEVLGGGLGIDAVHLCPVAGASPQQDG